jgi:hypothetical protein
MRPLEINDHQVIRGRVSQSLSDLFFEGFVPPFKISNYGHVSPRFYSKKRRAGTLREKDESLTAVFPKRPLIVHRKNRNPSATRFFSARWLVESKKH